MSNKVEKSIKRKANMLIRTIRWTVGAVIIGFLLTLLISCISAYKAGLVNTLSNLVTNYFNLVLEIANRNPTLAHYIIQEQSLLEAQAYQGLSDSNDFIASHFAQLSHSNHPVNSQLTAMMDSLKYHIYAAAYLVEWSFKLDVIKFISVFCSFMVFIFAGFLGLIDGLLARYIRTAEGGRESTFVYHHLADSLFKIPYCLIVAYIALPFPLNPLLVVVILAITTFLFCRVSTANLKKFI